jgi:predicted transcriptional regulator
LAGELFSIGYEDVPRVTKALNSSLRRRILELLFLRELNVNQIARELKIPQSTCAVNVKMLEKAGLIGTEQRPASKGAQKLCTCRCSELVLSLHDEEDSEESLELEMPVGLFFDYSAEPTCGLASEEGIIGYVDQPESFLHPQRSTAQLIWFSAGYLEYRMPVELHTLDRLRAIAISTELCSEYPGHNSRWPSDVTLWINGREIGTWTSPGDMGHRRGLLNPEWWGSHDTQYGFLKTWRVDREGSHVDGMASSEATLKDLDLGKGDYISVRIGIKRDAANMGGINLFGRGFGNYRQDLHMRLELDQK